MKRNKFLILYLVIFIFFGCEPKETPVRINFYDYQISLSDLNRKDLRRTNILYLNQVKNVGYTEFWYKDLKSADLEANFVYTFKNDSFFYFNDFCPIIDTLQFNFKDKSIEVFVSDFNIKQSYDEESLIFWNLKYGLIAEYNYPMGALFLFDNEQIEGFSKKVIYEHITQTNYFESVLKIK